MQPYGQPVTIIPQPTPMLYPSYPGQTNIHSNAAVNGPHFNLPQYEANWRAKFPRLPVIILSIIQSILTLLIFILEIASLAVAASYQPTGVGIWCAIPFSIACIFTFALVHRKDSSRMWASRALIAQIVLLVFTFILIGITGNYIQAGVIYNTFNYYGLAIDNPADTKYRIIAAQLSFGIFLMLSGFTYIAIYSYVTYVALWRPYHTLDVDHLFRQ